VTPAAELDRKTRLRLALVTFAAVVFSVILYKYTLRAWFQQDDFAWLGLRFQVHSAGDLLRALFQPMAQGTIRPISERAFFMVFSSLFGLHALPYRILVFLTQLAAIAMLSAVMWRLTRSLAAAFLAPVLWSANVALAEPMTWTSAYNEILCSFCFLLSFYGLVRFTQTGDRRYNVLQWVSFLLTFGVLEIDVMYPLIAVLYTLLFARPYLKRTLWLIVPAVAFAIVHTAVRPDVRNDVYALHLDASIFPTLLTYWKRSLGPIVAAENYRDWELFPIPLTLLISAGILWFVIVQARRRDWLPLFGLGWFVIALGPFLPVRDHIQEYYMTVPVIGLALLGGWAAAVALKSGWVYRSVAAVAIVAYLACSIPANRKLSWLLSSRSAPVRKLVQGVAAAHQQEPQKTILIEGVTDQLFWTGVYDHPFRLVGANRVYMTPEALQKITPDAETKISEYTIPEAEMMAELAQHRVIVFGLEGGDLHDITAAYEAAALNSQMPRKMVMGQPILESLLSKSWYPSEGDYRWMPKTASVHLGMPESGKGDLDLEAFCSPVQLKDGPLLVWVTIQGHRYGPHQIRDCSGPLGVRFSFTVTPGTKEADVMLEVNRTVRVGADLRDLGLALRNVEVISQP
jgi:hypothetical protein